MALGGFFVLCFVIGILKKTFNFKRFIVVLLAAFLGFFWFTCREVLTLNKAKDFNSKREYVCGVVKDFEKYDNGNCAYVLKVNKIADKKFLVAFNLKLFSKDNLNLNYGDRVRAEVSLSSVSSGDFFGYFFSSDVSKDIYLKGRDAAEIEIEHGFCLSSIFLEFRDRLIESVNRHVKAEEGSVANGILFGRRKAMPYIYRRAADRCGISHLFCVSGLHVSVLAFLLLSFFNLFKVPKKFSFPAIGLVLVIYSGAFFILYLCAYD